MLNKLENNLPHAAKPDAVYGIKNITIIIAEAITITPDLSRYLLLKNEGIVIEFPEMWEYLRILLATISQFKYVPIARPIAVHPASAIPYIYATPGSPINNQLLMSEASALIAVTKGPSFLPPR